MEIGLINEKGVRVDGWGVGEGGGEGCGVRVEGWP